MHPTSGRYDTTPRPLDEMPVPHATAAPVSDGGQAVGFQGFPVHHWTYRSQLDLGALPSAVPCARLHVREVLWEWKHHDLAGSVELVTSEILTNAVRASGGLDERNPTRTAPVPIVRLWLAADHQRVLVQVWDGNSSRITRQPQEPAPDEENGRGLLLVQALSADWGSYIPNGWRGKLVWAILERS